MSALTDTSTVDGNGAEKQRPVAMWRSSSDCEVQGLYAMKKLLSIQGHLA